MNSPITLTPDESVDIVIDGHTVTVQHTTDADGGHAIELTGRDCGLEGELPGLYYPVALAPR